MKNKTTATTTITPDFSALTGLRAVLASLIFINHYSSLVPNASSFLNDLLIGVSIFYTLSGFLIMYRYSDTVSLQTAWLKNYWVKRFARIYPAYFVLLLIQLIYTADHNPITFLLQVTLTHNFFEYWAGKIGIAASWSLTVEESFYLAAPFLMLLFRKHFLYPLLALLGLFLIAWGISVSQPIQKNLATISVELSTFLGTPIFVFFYTFFGRFFEFYIGMLVAWALLKKNALVQFLANIPRKIEIGLLGIAFVIFYLDRTVWGYEYVFVNNVVLPIFSIVLIFGLTEQDTWLSRLLSVRLMLVLGKSSYIFYLIHFTTTYTDFAKFVTTQLIVPFSSSISQNQTFLLNFYIAFYFVFFWILSVIIYLVLEKPANNFIKKWAKVV